MSTFEHASVLLSELVDSLDLQAGCLAVDCTAGGGGHTAEILKRIGEKGQVLAFDRDPTAIEELTGRFAKEIAAGQLLLIRAPFSQLGPELEKRGLFGQINAICADIGVSSPQLDQGDRGFSFNKEGPLDMRMDQDQTLSAALIVNTYSEVDLTRLFRDYGEDPQARPIARAIVRRRAIKPIETTLDLAELISGAVRYKEKSRRHPATKAFQALRIVVNDELGELQRLLDALPLALAPRGRASIISFHSLEDRLIKQSFRLLTEGKKAQIDRHLPVTAQELAILEDRQFSLIKPFPLIPSDQEQASNPRSRSAKLRVIERLVREET